MGKTYKGWELMKAISDGEIKNGSRFNIHRTYSAIAVLEDRILHIEDGNKRILTTNDLLIYTFELIEDEIDIDSIEEFEIVGCNIKLNDTLLPTENIINDMILDKMNKLVQAVKQIDKRVKKIEEK